MTCSIFAMQVNTFFLENYKIIIIVSRKRIRISGWRRASCGRLQLWIMIIVSSRSFLKWQFGVQLYRQPHYTHVIIICLFIYTHSRTTFVYNIPAVGRQWFDFKQQQCIYRYYRDVQTAARDERNDNNTKYDRTVHVGLDRFWRPDIRNRR